MGDGFYETKDEKNDKFNEEQDEKYPDVLYPVDMEEGDEKDDNTERFDEKKEAKGPYDNPPINMEESVHDKKMTRMIDLMMKKRHRAQMTLLLMIWMKVMIK